MVGTGGLMILLALIGVVLTLGKKLTAEKWQKGYLRLMLLAICLPYLANTAGWLITEMGRQPWIVYGLQKTADAVSTAMPAGYVLLTLIGFTLVYGVLAVVDVYLLSKYAKESPEDGKNHHETLAEEGSLWI